MKQRYGSGYRRHSVSGLFDGSAHVANITSGNGLTADTPLA
ncbi:MAG: hypothetical protein Q7U38_15105 [Methylobacter sp.]|nr:hypothetical protein [Methylobacter sp.]MDP2097513.1 hypothetical protein [Methylobacter sp.]MDP2429354.1 hypothetical protein [Methylobacter sp.]MDP3053779.1 hypothetical protein [Methylobacter sp.]MDP3362762.1 hypothetical protein [Methylobacter sp.]